MEWWASPKGPGPIPLGTRAERVGFVAALASTKKEFWTLSKSQIVTKNTFTNYFGDKFHEHIVSVGANTDLPVGKHFSSSRTQCERYASVRNLCGFQDNDGATQHGSKINLPSQDFTTKWNEH